MAVLLAACGSTAPTNTAANNAEDISFAQQMIPHHTQAVEMAKLVPSRSTNPKIQDLATRIQQAQDPEIKQLNDMLTKWNAPATSGPNHMGHGSGTLESMKGTEFDREWTSMMIEHHQGAIDMARTELAKGASDDAKALAQKVIDAQQAEITEMQALP
jgi:uncharacterized protein (DUF305 family)